MSAPTSIASKTSMLAATFLIVAAASPSQAADPSLDPGGWRQFKWGMSFQDADALANGQLSKYDTLAVIQDDLKYSGYKVDLAMSMPDGTPVNVELLFGCAGKGLVGVSLLFEKSKGAGMPGVAAQYGPPDRYEAPDKDQLGESYWDFPTTYIDASPGFRPQALPFVDYSWRNEPNLPCPARPLENKGF